MLKSFVDRIERLNEEIKGLNGDKSDLYAEAKNAGFDPKALKVVIGRRAKDPGELSELETLVATYEAALGTPVATRARTIPEIPAEFLRQKPSPDPRPAPIKPRPPEPTRTAAELDDIPPFLDRRVSA
jgi:uncharacterized protein (UPF0335 family)